MIKIFCDRCGVELNSEDSHTFVLNVARIKDVIDSSGRPDVSRETKTLCSKCSELVWQTIDTIPATK